MGENSRRIAYNTGVLKKGYSVLRHYMYLVTEDLRADKLVTRQYSCHILGTIPVSSR